MAVRKKVQYFNDFTGGLNLRTQRQSLAVNESPDCLDIDFNSRGGIVQRRGYKNATTDANMTTGTGVAGGYLVGQYSLGTDKLWGVSSAGRLWTWDSATATHVATAITSNVTTEFVRGVSWGSKLYFCNAYNGGSTLIMRTWNDAAFAALGNTANNNYTAPTGGNAPLARLMQDHGGYMWWADTVEAGTRFRYRLRFSHPLQPEDWAVADYFDIEPDDQSDQITALIPFRGQLMVFKKRAVYAVYGTTRDNFVVERISNQAGAWSQEGVSASQDHVFWWTPDGDVLAYDGNQVVSIGNKISTLVQSGVITSGSDHRVQWMEGRLWVSFLLADGTTRRTYIWDPRIGEGAWTRYSTQITSMWWWRRATGVNGIMVRVAGKVGVQDFNISNQATDFDGTTSAIISGYYATAWFAADDTALKKRWKRMNVTAASDDPSTLNVDVFYDFNESTVVKTLTMPIQLTAGGMVWGSGLWGVGVWGGSDPVYAFDRMQSAGRGHAVRFKFYMTDHLGGWSLDSYSLPFLEKAYR